MIEEWKAIEGYEGIYEVSNTGKVRRIIDRHGRPIENGHILCPHIARGYATVGLSNGTGHAKNSLVHRLVAYAFVQNQNGYKEVNHKDENKLNNNADNLEWCTREYNMSYGTARIRQGVSYGKPVVQLTIEGVPIARYCSSEIAGSINNIDPSSIHKCCKGKRKYAGGYAWSYEDYFLSKYQ